MALFRKPQPNPTKEIAPMSDYVQVHKPAVHRAIAAFDRAVSTLQERQNRIAALETQAAEDKGRIAALEALEAEHKLTIEALTAALDAKFPPDVGASMGGLT
jgi:acyl-CoA reductase-like NAD-dependent aldehyde dehydrogenase